MLTPDGQVKVLDFGLAKPSAPASVDPRSSRQRAHRPRPGRLLGTPTYMAPEQARGQADRPARRRLGVRLRALRVPHRAARVRRRDADRRARRGAARRARLRARSPRRRRARVRELLARCLEKDPRARGCATSARRASRSSARRTRATATRRRRRPRPPIALWLGAAALRPRGRVFVALVAAGHAEPASAPHRTSRRGCRAACGSVREDTPTRAASLAHLARTARASRSSARRAPTTRLYVRSLRSPRDRRRSPAPRTRVGPFFSPDGAGSRFSSRGKLRKVASPAARRSSSVRRRDPARRRVGPGRDDRLRRVDDVAPLRVSSEGGGRRELTELDPAREASARTAGPRSSRAVTRWPSPSA